METKSDDYSEYLEEKYLPGRDIYLNRLFYPRVFNELGEGSILDLGFGAGAFLKFASGKGRKVTGIDSNDSFVAKAKDQGFKVALDDITTLSTISGSIENAVTDNVLEHLEEHQIDSFFKAFNSKLAPGGRLVAIVPDAKGYEKDPTHRTFVTQEYLTPICKKHGLTIRKYFCFPFNNRTIGKFFYLNMQIFVIERPSE